jgi:hypothetical protein
MSQIKSGIINLSLIFKPKFQYENLEYYLSHTNINDIKIENDEIYILLQELTDLAYPTCEDKYDERWEYFYVPVKKGRKTISIPIWIMRYNEEFFVTVQSFGNFHIKKETEKKETEKKETEKKETEKFYKHVFAETLRFIPIIKKDESIIQKTVPYDIRTGRIKGRYIMDELLSKHEKETILEDYGKHILNNHEIKDISLNDYLNVAAICYHAAYKDEAKNLSPVELYKNWADGRDGDMLSIKDWNSNEEFSEWRHSGMHIGSHPFEIVFSWHGHGIHLYPPDESLPCYNIRVTNYAYAQKFIEMIDALIKNKIMFKAHDLESVLDFLTGDTYFIVNKLTEHSFRYIPSREYKQKYFPYIEWDDLKIVKWKTNEN